MEILPTINVNSVIQPVNLVKEVSRANACPAYLDMLSIKELATLAVLTTSTLITIVSVKTVSHLV